jgi:catalase
MVTDGVNLALLDALKKEIEIQGATMEVIAPVIGGVVSSAGRPISVKQKIGGGPSVLYDAVAILPSEEGTQGLLRNAAAAEFIADAFGHCKFIAWVRAALPLFEKAGIADAMDEACIELTGPKSVTTFLSACKRVRHWEREKIVTF